MKRLLLRRSLLPLTHQKPAKSIPIFQGVEGWGELDVEEIVEALKQVYTNYQTAQAKGQAAAHFMQDWTGKNKYNAVSPDSTCKSEVLCDPFGHPK